MTEKSDRPPLAYPSMGKAIAWAARVVGGTLLAATLAAPAVAAPVAKYYFQLHEVKSRVPLDGEIRQFAGDALKAELAGRPEWQSDLANANDPDAMAAELKRRHLSGFDVVVKIAELKKEVKEPNPGSRLKRLAVSVKLAVLGTTLPGEKIAFGGDGEASAEAEVSERRMEAEAESMLKDCIKDAVKQAVDQAVLKLGMPRSAPHNESRRNRHKDKGGTNGAPPRGGPTGNAG
ncbi:MAG: hypothetical protein ABIS92_06400 [Polyangia bacterium]